MVVITKEVSSMIRETAKEFLFGQMEENMMDSGKMENSME